MRIRQSRPADWARSWPHLPRARVATRMPTHSFYGVRPPIRTSRSRLAAIRDDGLSYEQSPAIPASELQIQGEYVDFSASLFTFEPEPHISDFSPTGGLPAWASEKVVSLV